MVAALCLTGCPSDDDVPLDADPTVDAGRDAPVVGPVRFTVATWNVENFFDTRNDPDRADDVLSSGQYGQKIEDVSNVLLALDADLVALQEVENLGILEDLATGPANSLGYTEMALMDSFDGRGIDVGFLARVPITNVASHLGEQFPSPDGSEEYFFARDALEVFAEPGGIPITVMIVHFLSMSAPGNGDDRRLAEAMQCRRIAERRLESGVDRMLIVGDFNDLPDSDPLDALLGDASAFTDLTRFVPSADRYTFVFDRREQQIDYMLGTANVEAELLEARILHGAEIEAASDHAPIVMTFDLGR